MQFSAKTADPVTAAAACIVVGVVQGKRPALTAAGARLDRATGKALSAALGRGGLDGRLGGAQVIYRPPGIKASRVLLVGLGPRDADDSASPPSNLRRAAAVAAKLLDVRGIASALLCLPDGASGDSDARRCARDILEGMRDALYRFDQTKSGDKKPRRLKRVQLLCAREELAAARQGLREGMAVAGGVALARDYANLPGNICTPTYLAAEAKRLGKERGIAVTVLDEAAMKKHKMGSLLSVSRGSREPAKLIVLEYHGAGDGSNDGGDKNGGGKKPGPVVLVGKGLTFDAGGISLKPAAGMDEMKFDMCGGASVLGALQAAAELELNLDIVGLVPCSENLPDGAANKPGDIVTSMAGTTIEILNTDAEGRLILCDALTYAERFKPAAVVDIATLTGACAVALGAHASGLFSDCDALAEELLAAGQASGDRAWRMPVWDDYAKQSQRRPRLAHAGVGRLRQATEEQLRRPRQHRRALRGGGDRGLLPQTFHRQIRLGAPRHRGNGVEIRRRQRRHRAAGAVVSGVFVRAGGGVNCCCAD